MSLFAQASLIGNTERGIALATCADTHIENTIAAPRADLRQQARIVSKFGARWKLRKRPSPRYNCAGHVWASRRTSIFEDKDYQLILKEDGYRKLQESETPLPGDLALYTSEHGLLHVGRVIDSGETLPGGSVPFPIVLSKWDAWSGEYVHGAYDVGHLISQLGAEVAFWTERFWEET